MFGATWQGIIERSIDGGPWQKLWPIPESTAGPALVWSLAVSNGGQVIYAGTYTGHVWRSMDGGQHWARADGGEFGFNNAVLSLTIDPRNPTVVYGGTGYGLFKTVDGGSPWARVPWLPQQSGVQVALSPRDPDSVWTAGVVSYNGGSGRLYHSTDGGRTWAEIVGPGIPTSNGWGGLAVSPAHDSVVYVTDEKGLYRTADDGAHWLRIGAAEIQYGGAIAISRAQPKRLYVITYSSTQAVYASDDDGATWVQASGLPQGVPRIVPDPVSPLVAYTAGPDGVYRTTDGGTTWSLWLRGSPANVIAVTAATVAQAHPPSAPPPVAPAARGGRPSWWAAVHAPWRSVRAAPAPS